MKNWLLWLAIGGAAYYFVIKKAGVAGVRVLNFDPVNGLAEIAIDGRQFYLSKGEGLSLTDGRRVEFVNNQLLLYAAGATTPTVLR